MPSEQALNIKQTRETASHLVSEWDNTRQQADEDVCVNTPLMSLVYDYHTVSLEQEIL